MSSVHIDYIIMNDIRDIKNYHIVAHKQWNNALSCFNNNKYLVAIYLAGYSAECILKYVIMENTLKNKFKNNQLSLKAVCNENGGFKPLKRHNINKLIKLGNDKNVFKTPKESDFIGEDITVTEWNNEWRYSYSDNINKDIAERFLKSVVDLSEKLKEELIGIVKVRPFKLNF